MRPIIRAASCACLLTIAFLAALSPSAAAEPQVCVGVSEDPEGNEGDFICVNLPLWEGELTGCYEMDLILWTYANCHD